MNLHQSDATSWTTPGTRRTWSTGHQWLKHLRDLVRKQGTRGRYAVDLEAHLVACDRAFLRSRSHVELVAIKHAFEEPKVRGLVRPPQGQRAGSPYVLIVDEVHNALHRIRMAHATRERWAREEFTREARRVQLRLPFDVDVADRRAA